MTFSSFPHPSDNRNNNDVSSQNKTKHDATFTTNRSSLRSFLIQHFQPDLDALVLTAKQSPSELSQRQDELFHFYYHSPLRQQFEQQLIDAGIPSELWKEEELCKCRFLLEIRRYLDAHLSLSTRL